MATIQILPNISSQALVRVSDGGYEAWAPASALPGGQSIDGGVLSGSSLLFKAGEYRYTKNVTTDEFFTLDPASVTDSFIVLTTYGDGSHNLAFPSTWVMKGDTFDSTKIQEIIFRYTPAGYVVGVITTLNGAGDLVAPTVSSAVIEHSSPSVLKVTYDEPVNTTSAGFTVTASGGAVTVTGITSGNGTTTPRYSLSRSITQGETITFSYSGGITTDLGGNLLGSFSNTAVTNEVVTEIIYMTDDFNDASIDGAKWITTNPGDGVAITETTTLNFVSTPGSPVASANTNYVENLTEYPNTKYVARATLTRNSSSVNLTQVMRVHNSTDTYATAKQAQITKNVAGKFLLRVYDGSTFVYDQTTAIDWTTSATPVRIISNGTTITFQYWTGTWTTLGAYTGLNLGTNLQTSFNQNSSASDSGTPTMNIDAFYITNYEFTGSTP
jgi:hypothetical protein